MRYWHPFTEESLGQLYEEGTKRIIALSLYPHYSVATTGSSIKHFKDAAAKYPFEYSCITSWSTHPLYIDALAARIEEGLKGFDAKPAVLFSAPQSSAENCHFRRSIRQMKFRGTIDALTKRLDLQWYLSYQSKTGPVKWLGLSTRYAP